VKLLLKRVQSCPRLVGRLSGRYLHTVWDLFEGTRTLRWYWVGLDHTRAPSRREAATGYQVPLSGLCLLVRSGDGIKATLDRAQLPFSLIVLFEGVREMFTNQLVGTFEVTKLLL
jgi:hypothetical protein